MKTKKQQLLKYIKDKCIGNALAIAKNFVIEFTQAEQRTLQIAHESQSKTRAAFYSSIGIDVNAMNQEAIEILENYYLRFG